MTANANTVRLKLQKPHEAQRQMINCPARFIVGCCGLHFTVMDNMFGLAGKQLQIFYFIITRIFVYVMDNFCPLQIATDMFFHNKAVFKNIFQTCVVSVCGARVIVGCDNQNISVFSYLTTAFPAWRQMFRFTKHWVVSTETPNAEHWVVFARNISMERRVGIGQVFCGSMATFTAKLRWSQKIGFDCFFTNLARNHFKSYASGKLVTTAGAEFSMSETIRNFKRVRTLVTD